MTYDCATVLQTLIVLNCVQLTLITGLIVFNVFKTVIIHIPPPSDGGF